MANSNQSSATKTHFNPSIPRGRRVYAIGDIHGRFDLLEDLHHAILEDSNTAKNLRKTIIHLGDYIDRGPDSFDVIDYLATFSLEGFDIINLKGNHEDFLLRFMQEHSKSSQLFDVWRDNGCTETLLSYSIDIRNPEHYPPGEEAALIRQQLSNEMPDKHITFYKSLKLRHTIGDYLFVHAGINPANPINKQQKNDLLWIRNRFLNHPGPFDKIVVHGHSISKSPETLDYRIGIDTGAYFSDRLTCLVLEGQDKRFLKT